MFRRLLLICVAVQLLMPGRQATAQSPENPRIRELNARYDSIWPLLVAAETTHRAMAIAARNAAAAKKAEKLDTALVGPLTVIAQPGFIDEARQYVAGVWQDFETSARAAEAQLSGITLLVESNKPVAMFRPMSQRPRHMLLQLPSLLSPQARRAYGARAIGTQLTASTPPAIRNWLMGTPLSWERNDARIYRELAMSRSKVSVECYRQQTRGCIDALAMTQPDSLWSNWYTSAQLRELALEAVNPWNRRMRDFDECARLSRVEKCAAFLRWAQAVPLPLSAGARSSFLSYALERGGEGSLARLLASNADVQSAIEAAAAQPVEPLVASWRNQVQKNRPEMHAGVTRSRVAIIFWMLVCAGLAMRSTRWRLA